MPVPFDSLFVGLLNFPLIASHYIALRHASFLATDNFYKLRGNGALQMLVIRYRTVSFGPKSFISSR